MDIVKLIWEFFSGSLKEVPQFVWDNPYLLFLLVILPAWQSFRQYQKLKQGQVELEAKAAGIDWDVEVEDLVLPLRGLPHAKNSARMAIWAVAAYGGRGKAGKGITDDIRELLHDKLEKDHEGRVIPWELENAEGVIADFRQNVMFDDQEKSLIIAIAGTNDKEDALADAITASQKISDWGESIGVEIAGDSVNARSTSGFLGYSALCIAGINQALKEHDIDLKDYASVWITGHSLGGAATSILLTTQQWEKASAFTYGGARPLKRFANSPKRTLSRTVDLLDPVQWVPVSCKHFDSKQIIVTPIGSRSKMPGRYKFLLFFVVIGYWVAGLAGDILNKAGFKNSMSIAKGHSMESYMLNRKPFRE